MGRQLGKIPRPKMDFPAGAQAPNMNPVGVPGEQIIVFDIFSCAYPLHRRARDFRDGFQRERVEHQHFSPSILVEFGAVRRKSEFRLQFLRILAPIGDQPIFDKLADRYLVR